MFPDIRGLRRPLFAFAAGLAMAMAPFGAANALQGEGFAQDRSDIAADPAVRYGQLDNGLRYAILQNDTPPDTASIRMAFNVGSMVEEDDQRGLAHFIEHMAFNGSENVPEGEMVALLERYGLQFGPDTNAGTSREYVVYQLDMPEVDDETIDTGLFIMRETASNLTLDIDAIDRERDIILSEERLRNTPVRRWSNALMEFRYPDSLVAQRDAIGIPEVIQTAPREAFARYYDEFYRPDRAMLVIVGDIDVDRVEAEIADVYADWAASGNPAGPPVAGSVDPDRGFETGYFHDPDFFTVLTVESVQPDTIEEDTMASRFDGLLDSLATGIVSRRMSTIISSGTSPLIQGGANFSTEEYGFAARANILAVAQPDRWEEGLAVVEQELRRALEHGFTQSELDEQLTNLRTALETSVEQADTRVSSSLSDALWSSWRFNQVFGHPVDALARYNEYEDDITVEAVHAAFRDQWAGNGPLVFLATSLEIDNAEARIADVWNESAQTAVDAMEDVEIAAWAYEDFGTPGEVVERTEIDDLGVTRLVFDNGVRVSLKQTDFENDVIRMTMTFGRGDLEPRNEAVVDTVASSVFTSGGLEAHSFDDLGRILAGRNVGGSFSVNAGSFSMSGSTTPADLELQFQLFAAYMTAPGYRPESLAQFRASLPELRRNLGSTPGGVRTRDISRMLRSGDQRFGFPTQDEADDVDLDDVRAFLTPALESAPIEITVVGDFEEQAVIDAIAATIGALPDRAEDWPEYDDNRILEFPEATETPIVLTHNGGDDQALVNVYWPTTDDSDVHVSRTIRLMRAVLALKLTERLREGEAFTYSASSSNVESFYHPDYGYLYVGADVRVENIDPVYEAIGLIAADMVNGEITDDEMLRARRPLLEQIQNAFESNGVWLGWLSQSFEYPERLDRIRTITDDYSDITLEEIVVIARTYLSADTAYRVTVVPAAAE
ncbi:insulinase family protein [Hyphobacterium sp. CCMP332]|uniref:M16 family metallopeptidase n=1 Tax=Hyphobacterium sp. CCMP332 TaxID=2749086 RepID=UPI00164FE23F|nr:insulinase family protein [Hyphobacterium sp. CCMP332]QNL19592.1 insulinase family protein [Hyphobacterium sp. CCMP332]